MVQSMSSFVGLSFEVIGSVFRATFLGERMVAGAGNNETQVFIFERVVLPVVGFLQVGAVQHKSFFPQQPNHLWRDFFFLKHRRNYYRKEANKSLEQYFLSTQENLQFQDNSASNIKLQFQMDQFKIGLKTSYVAGFVMLIVAANSYISPSNFTKYVESPKDTTMFSKAHTMGTTVNNNQLIIFTISKFPYQKLSQLEGRDTILISSYMHAREPYSIELAFKLYQNIATNQMIPALSNFLETGFIIFYPFVNADGYKQFVKADSRRQEIRKNFNKGNQKCQFGQAGVDINRNFDSSFGAVASSTYPCSEQYRGAAPFSQNQSKVFKEIFTMFKVIIAIDIHSYGNEWIYPYASDARQQKIKNRPLFGIYNEVINRFRSNNFTIQSCFQSLGYIADGVYIDWALDQGAFSLAYEVGKNFNSDDGIAEEIKRSLQAFDTLFAFLEPKIVAFQKGTTLQLHSKSIAPLHVKIVFDSSQQQGKINPGQSLLFNIPLNSSSLKIFLGKQQLLSSSLAQPPQLYESKLVVLSILIVLTLLHLLIYKCGKVGDPELKKRSFSSKELKDEIQIRNSRTQQNQE